MAQPPPGRVRQTRNEGKKTVKTGQNVARPRNHDTTSALASHSEN
jgi:hypothetical protein